MSQDDRDPYYKTTIVIWSKENPDIAYDDGSGFCDLATLALAATTGDAHCPVIRVHLVEDAKQDPDWIDSSQFFDAHVPEDGK